MKKPAVCYILSYYSPSYVRTETLIQALEKIKGIALYQARNNTKGFLRYFETLWKLIIIRLLHNPEYYILGFRGYEIFCIVRLITLGKTLVFDHMMSPYDSLINERQSIRRGGWIDRTIYFYEKCVLTASNLVLTDTEVHKAYFCELFNLPQEKIEVVHVGTDESIFRNDRISPHDGNPKIFEVLYYGSFLPLHGIEIILKAASILLGKPIHFTLIGGNHNILSVFNSRIGNLDLHNVTHIDWVDYNDLPKFIERSSIGLGGPFGQTGQAGRVITGKTFQFLAMAKPVIIGKSNNLDSGFEDKENCLLVPRGDETALANAILWGLEHFESLESIGQRGLELYRSRYSIRLISKKLQRVLSL